MYYVTMKLTRFVKKLWSDFLSESDDLKDFIKHFWRSIYTLAIFIGFFWAVGKGVELIGLSKYFPKDASGKEVGPFINGMLFSVSIGIALLIIFAIYLTVYKLKKTWDEV